MQWEFYIDLGCLEWYAVEILDSVKFLWKSFFKQANILAESKLQNTGSPVAGKVQISVQLFYSYSCEIYLCGSGSSYRFGQTFYIEPGPPLTCSLRTGISLF